MSQWRTFKQYLGGDCLIVHVIPIDDLREHGIDYCWCRPTLEPDEPVLVHHAADNREAFERGERKAS